MREDPEGTGGKVSLDRERGGVKMLSGKFRKTQVGGIDQKAHSGDSYRFR